MKILFVMLFVLGMQNVWAGIPDPENFRFNCLNEEEIFDFHFTRSKVRGAGRAEPSIKNFIQVMGQNAVDVNYHSGRGDIISFVYKTYIYDGGRAPSILRYKASFFTEIQIASVPTDTIFDGYVSINQKEFFPVVCVKN